jgi:predicted GNAT family N-acyltransferase
MGVINKPVVLTLEHDIYDFDCGDSTLSHWLKRKALKNQIGGGSKTFVIADNKRVIGYYALASGSVERLLAPKNVSRNMPEPIPVMVLGRLAIDIEYQGQSLGGALLKDALLRCKTVSENVGVRAVLVHAISEQAKRFYGQYGFQESPIDEMTLFLAMKSINTN